MKAAEHIIILAVLPFILVMASSTATVDIQVLQDTYVSEANPDTNYGDVEYLMLSGEPGNRSIIFIRFDVSRIPANTAVVSAEASLYRFDGSPEAVLVVNGEEFLVTTIGWVMWDFTELTRQWYTGEIPNDGISLESGSDSWSAFHSKESLETDKRPKLVVTYEDIGPPSQTDWVGPVVAITGAVLLVVVLFYFALRKKSKPGRRRPR